MMKHAENTATLQNKVFILMLSDYKNRIAVFDTCEWTTGYKQCKIWTGYSHAYIHINLWHN